MSKITYEVVEHGGGRYLPGPSDTPFAYKKRTQPSWGLRERVADTCTRFKVDRLLIEAKDLTQKFQLEAQRTAAVELEKAKAELRKELLEQVWRMREDTDTRAIDNFIVRLRRYIEDDASRPRHLVTVRGVGYSFVASPISK